MGLLLAYLALLSLLALAVRDRSAPGQGGGHTFAIIVPAHNEELALAPTVQSLQNLSYFRERYNIIVIADNCTDKTADIGRSLGARVLERKDVQLRGKGHALRWCMDLLLRESPSYDAFVVIDADTEVAVDFLEVMDRYLSSGARVIQSSDMVKPQPGAWSAELTRIGFTLYNHARPLGRSAFGGSAGLRGNGMCFAASVLRAHPWDAYSRAEDLEYGLRLLLEGTRVTFAPGAKVFATMPDRAANAETQRARWEGGRLPLIRKYFGPLVRRAVLGLSVVHADALVDLVTPPLVNMLSLTVLFLGVNIILALFGVHGALVYSLCWAIASALGFLHLFAGLAASRADRDQFAALFHLPQYVIWKLFLYARLVGKRKEREWIRTTREVPRRLE